MSLSNFDPTPLARPLARATPRPIVHRTRGATHGPITRLVSPSDVGELMKPFVFLDFFSAEPRGFGGFGWHPHSGIATVSVILKGAVSYEETTGAKGILSAGAVEWMRAGGGVWHTGGSAGTDRVEGYQLWVALPPDLESGPSASHYVQREDVATEGPYRVILGRYGNAKSAIAAPPTMNCLVVDLKAGERWAYVPPPGHTVGWIAVHAGKALAPAPVARGELAVFARSNDPIELVADGDTSFILGSAVPHPHDLFLGSYSVHTSPKALADGEAEIRRIRDTSEVLRPVLQRGRR
jgi:redox-sensitive bicupin YhaK (pirin superfamily)